MSFDLIDQQQAIGNRLSAIDNQCFFFCLSPSNRRSGYKNIVCHKIWF